MRYRITHTTDYRYSDAVQLRPHILRLCPRSDGMQWLQKFEITLSPDPVQQTYFLDENGTTCLRVGFDSPLEAWHIQTVSEVYTTRDNPFDYLAEPWAMQLPVDYPSSLAVQLRPYWDLPLGGGIDDAITPEVIAIAHTLMAEVDNNTSYFLTRLTQLIPEKCVYQQRLEGMPQAAAVTLNKHSGTCRDFTVLFMAVCRAVGLAARFVSGYQEGDLEQNAHDLHAWAEVYVPGGGWRGFDPTLGLAVSDRHVVIAAAADPKQAAPVTGTLQPGQRVETTLESDIHIEAVSEALET
ncbi:MAG: transglutaminase family protein [Phormidesmis sp.]